jgi:VCBS repeat protein/FG-GAP repeat protein
MNRRANRGLFVGCIAVPLAFARVAGATGPCIEPCKVLHSFASEGSTDRFGWALDVAGDLDGDGAPDFVVGAPNNGAGAGKAYIYSGATGALLFAVSGNPNEYFGYAVAAGGDVDGDGVPDVVVGAPGINGLVGHVAVCSGVNGSPLLTVFGENPADGFGVSVATAGDVDGDSIPDVLVGASIAGPTGAGRVYVFSGGSGMLLRTLDGEVAGDHFGSAASLVGDVDGDGVGDFVIGAADAGPALGGKVYVFSGATGALLWAVNGGSTSINFGYRYASGSGDVNGDGVPDVFVGDWNDTARGQFTGQAFVLSGVDGSTILTLTGVYQLDGLGNGRGAGDVDGDGHADLIVGDFLNHAGGGFAGRVAIYSGRDGSRLRQFTGALPDAQFGENVLALGDVDGDGSTDYVITALVDAGSVYVISGSAIVGRPMPHVAGSPTTIRVTGCLPGARVVLAGSTSTGTTPIPQCPGRTLGLASPRALRPVVADANGNAVFGALAPASLHGRTVWVQALELPQCRRTDPISVTFL